MKIRFWFITIVVISLLASVSCKKSLIAVYMKLDTEEYNTFEQDIIPIVYTVHGAFPDSSSLFVNSQFIESLPGQENVFMYSPDSTGEFTFKVTSYLGADLEDSEPVTINIRQLNSPELAYIVKRVDGEQTYFVGEELSINIRPKWSHTSIDNFSKISLNLNGEFLGTKTSPPFTFNTPVINNSENILMVELTDIENKIHKIEHELIVPVNQPPEISITQYNSSGITHSVNNTFINYECKDNVLVTHLDFYVDDIFHSTLEVNRSFYFDRYDMGFIEPGNHNIYCIAYDDRLDTTRSSDYSLSVLKTYIISDEIVDAVGTNDNQLAYMVSHNKLYVINPQEELLSDSIDLPKQMATAIDYMQDNQRLYIGFEGGEIVYWDSNAEIFSDVTLSAFQTITDMEVDYSSNMAVVVSGNDLYGFNLDTKAKTDGDVELEDNSSISLANNGVFVVGGTPGVSSNRFHRFSLFSDSLYHSASKSFGAYTEKIIISPNGDNFVLVKNPGVYTTRLVLYDINSFGNPIGEFEVFQPQTAALNSDGSMLYAGNNWDDEIIAFNTQNQEITETYEIPISSYNKTNHIVVSNDQSKLVLAYTDTFYDDYKIVFLRTGY